MQGHPTHPRSQQIGFIDTDSELQSKWVPPQRAEQIVKKQEIQSIIEGDGHCMKKLIHVKSGRKGREGKGDKKERSRYCLTSRTETKAMNRLTQRGIRVWIQNRGK